MPIYISWVNPKTRKRERIYNYYDADSPEGRAAIEAVLNSLSVRFRVSRSEIPGFEVKPAEWRPIPFLRGFGDEDSSEL